MADDDHSLLLLDFLETTEIRRHRVVLDLTGLVDENLVNCISPTFN